MYKKILIISMFIVSLFGVTVFAHDLEYSHSANDYGSHYLENDKFIEVSSFANGRKYVLWFGEGTEHTIARFQAGVNFGVESAKIGLSYTFNGGDFLYCDPKPNAVSVSIPIDSTYTLVSANVNVYDNSDNLIYEYEENGGGSSGGEITPDNMALNSIYINNLKDNIKVTGYLTGTSPLKWYDIEVYGKFVSDNNVFVNPSILKTYIVNNTVVAHGSEQRRMGEGLGLKSFSWIKEPSGKGTVGQFKMVVTMPMLKEGIHNVKIGTTINIQPVQTFSYEYMSDTVKDVEFLSDNFEDNFEKPPIEVPEGGTSGNVGSGGNGSDLPTLPDDAGILDYIKYVIDMFFYLISYPFKLLGDIIITTSGYIKDAVSNLAPVGENLKAVLSFIPDDIMNTLWGILCFSIIFSTIKMITGFMRGA